MKKFSLRKTKKSKRPELDLIKNSVDESPIASVDLAKKMDEINEARVSGTMSEKEAFLASSALIKKADGEEIPGIDIDGDEDVFNTAKLLSNYRNKKESGELAKEDKDSIDTIKAIKSMGPSFLDKLRATVENVHHIRISEVDDSVNPEDFEKAPEYLIPEGDIELVPEEDLKNTEATK